MSKSEPEPKPKIKISISLKPKPTFEFESKYPLSAVEDPHLAEMRPIDTVRQEDITYICQLMGSHVPKDKTVLRTIQREPYHKPIQLFFNGNRTTKITVNAADAAATKEFLASKPRRVVVHAPYSLNLCMEPGSMDDYFIISLKNALREARNCGFEGVVFHTGKLKRTTDSMAHMRVNVQKCLEEASLECPLLLETPAGQGNEQLCKPEELAEFVKEIGDARFGICVDTCHVFAAGHDPIEYWNTLREQGVAHLVKVIHYNDSKGAKGSCVDRHAQMGQGLIPSQTLIGFALYCLEHNLPLIRE